MKAIAHVHRLYLRREGQTAYEQSSRPDAFLKTHHAEAQVRAKIMSHLVGLRNR